MLLALLAVGVAAYWALPRLLNDWTKAEAVAYLRSITGGRVRIQSVRFSLFGGIRVGGVKVDAPNSLPDEHLFVADAIVLRHRPWALVSEGRLEPTEIICSGSTLSPGVNTEDGRLNFRDLIEQVRNARPADGAGSLGSAPLPMISFRDVRLQCLGGVRLLDLSLIPEARQYRIVVEQLRDGQDTLRATWRLDLDSGDVQFVEGTVPSLDDASNLLPAQYAKLRKKWRKDYGMQGKVLLKGRSDASERLTYLDARLDNVSLRLPIGEMFAPRDANRPDANHPDANEPQSHVELVGVAGTLTFHAGGVTTGGLTGRLPQAGNAEFTLKGGYHGYDANSRLELSIGAKRATMPDANTPTAWLAEALGHIHRSFQPVGPFDLHVDIRRDANGKVDYKGWAKARGMTATYIEFPYTVREVTGTLRFSGDANGQWAFLEGMEGRHGSAKVTVNGKADLLRKRGPYDISVVAENAELDEQLRSAIPAKFRRAWDDFSPAGRMEARVRTWKTALEADPNIDLTLIMDGRASMTYTGFPYRLDELEGQVHVDDEKVEIHSVKGRRGAMHCTVDGEFSGLAPRGGRVRLSVDATDVPLDANLTAALPGASRPKLEKLHLTGLSKRVSGWIRQEPNRPLDFRLTAGLTAASLRPPWVRAPFEDAHGSLTIRPTRVIVEQVQARYLGQPVRASGQVLLDANDAGVDLCLMVPAARFAEGVCRSLPDSVQKAWRRLAPTGTGDVELLLRSGPEDSNRPLDYRLTVDANGMGIRYADFPYALTGIRGRAVITPAGVSLSGITARHGEATFEADGNMTFTPTAEILNLQALRGRDVPIDKDLLEAMPRTLAPLARRFQPGGTCKIDFRRLKIVTPTSEPNAPPADAAPPATMPASAPADKPPAEPALPAPASAPALATLPPRPVEPPSPAPPASRPATGRRSSWLVDGNAAVVGATVDIGLGHKTMTGSIRGVVGQSGEELSVDAAIELDSVKVGSQELTDLSGRLVKKPGGRLMRLTDLQARAHGGQVAGFAEVRLSDPLELGLSVSVRGIRLEDMFAAMSGGKAAPGQKVKGLLAGNLQFTSIESAAPRRQASGVLRITRGELVKLPVMLGLLNVMYLNLPGDTAFTDGELTYHMRNDDLIFDEIYFRGPGLSIVGSGRMDMETEKLNLRFLSGPPQKLPRLGALSEMLEGVAREVAEIHVDGTLAKPRMRTMPLQSLDRLIRELLHPEKKK